MNHVDQFTQFSNDGAADQWCALYDTVRKNDLFFAKDPGDFLKSAKKLLQHNFDCAPQIDAPQTDIVQRVQDYISHCWTHAHSPSRVSRFCTFIINSNNHELKIQAHPLVVKALARGLVSERHELIVQNWIDEYTCVIQNQIQNATISQALPENTLARHGRKI